MTTKEINQALNEFDMFNKFIPLENEVLHPSLIGKTIHDEGEVYLLDNIEDIKRYYINAICINKYNEDHFRNMKIFRSRIECLLNTLYLGNVSEFIIDILTEHIYNGFEENNN